MTQVKMSAFVVLGCGLVMLVLAAPVRAAIIQYQFSGTVVSIQDDGHLGGLVQLGDPYVATFVFDTATPDEFPSYFDRAGYSGLSASLVMPHISVNAQARLDIADSATFDFVYFSTTDPGLMFLITLNDSTGTALTSDVIPSPFPTFADFPESSLDVFWDHTVSDKFAGSIDSVNVTIIPEPGALYLTVLGSLTLLVRRVRCL